MCRDVFLEEAPRQKKEMAILQKEEERNVSASQLLKQVLLTSGGSEPSRSGERKGQAHLTSYSDEQGRDETSRKSQDEKKRRKKK